MKIKVTLFLLFFSFYVVATAKAPLFLKTNSSGDFVVVQNGKSAVLVTDANDYEVVQIAAKDLGNDIFSISGIQPKQLHNLENTTSIVMGTLGKSAVVDEVVKKYKLDVSGIKGQWEKFIVKSFQGTKNSKILVVIGSDRRGTAYGIYELSKQLGVSPWYWWADVPVQKSKNLILKSQDSIYGPPSIKYRGIFINDEFDGLDPWARKILDPESGQIGPKTYAKIFELMLRLKANVLWPAMKRKSAFYQVKGNKEMADSYGIIMGTSHHEPLLVNSSLEWNEKTDGPWQYDTNTARMKKVMDDRVKETASFENIYTIGLRGNEDLGMKSEGGLKERISLMETIFQDQRDILKKHIPKAISQIPQIFTAYKEVLEILNNGLKVPDDAILVWPDDNYGYIQQLDSELDKNRSGGSGIYYHFNYLGRPFPTTWLSAPSPELVRKELNKAYGYKANQFWMFNVGDIKPYEFLSSFVLDMAWKFPYNDTSYTQNYLKQWLTTVFGENLSSKIQPIINGYYQSAFERKPEFMGWDRTEPTTSVVNTEYSLSHYQEAETRLEQLDNLAKQTKELLKVVPEHLKATFFQLVYYPILSADLANKKYLYAQMNKIYAQQQRISANTYANKSRVAMDSLNLLVKQYDELLGGKWKNMMRIQWGTPRKDVNLIEVNPSIKPEMGIDFTGKEWKEGMLQYNALPVFNSYYKETYDITIFNKGGQSFSWQAVADKPWIKLSQASGICKDEQKIKVSVDWATVPKENQSTKGEIVIKGANVTEKIVVQIFNQQIAPEISANIFVEQNGVVSINAANFNRKNDKKDYKWTTLEHIGITNKLVAITDDTLPRIPFEWNLAENAPSLEYDFYTYNQGWVELQSFTLPTHAINAQRGNLYAVSIDNQAPKIIDFSTSNRNEEWMLNVQRNTAIKTSKHFIENTGKHTLKVWLIDTDVCFDKFIIDMGGLKPSYLGPKETRKK